MEMMADLPDNDAMLAFILRFVQDRRHSNHVTVPVDNSSEYLALHGLINRARRFTRAHLRLRKSGFAPEGRVLVRSALEHSVTAQWAYLTPSGIDRLRVSLTTAQRDLARSMITYSSDPTWISRTDELTSAIAPGPALPKFNGPNGILAELDSVKFLQTTYRVLSQVGHVTHQAATDSVIEVDGKVHLADEPEETMDVEVLYTLVGVAMMTEWLVARLEGNTDEIRRLHKLAQDLHVPWRLETHLPNHRRRFPHEDS